MMPFCLLHVFSNFSMFTGNFRRFIKGKVYFSFKGAEFCSGRWLSYWQIFFNLSDFGEERMFMLHVQDEQILYAMNRENSAIVGNTFLY